jgi:hypothetical protein
MNPDKTFPRNIEDAVQHVLSTFPHHFLDGIKSLPENELNSCHLTIGGHLRAELGLWSANTELLADCGCDNPDEATGFIMWPLWRKLQDNGK